MAHRSKVMKATRILGTLWGLALLVAFLSSSRCATTALSKRSADKPIKVFELGERIPRNAKVIDIIEPVGPWGYTAFGTEYRGSGYPQTIRYLKKIVKARGGDAVAILYVEKDFWPNVKACLLDMIDINEWPRVSLTEEEIRRDFNTRERMVDDIEGIWDCHVRSAVMMDAAALKMVQVAESTKGILWSGDQVYVLRVPPSVIQAMEQLSPEQQSSFRVAIIKAAGDPDYPYAAYILDPDIPEWKPGFLKARLRKLPDSSGYEAKWYGTTFQDDPREFHPDETGALKTKVVIEQGLKYSIEQTLTKVYPPTKGKNMPDKKWF